MTPRDDTLAPRRRARRIVRWVVVTGVVVSTLVVGAQWALRQSYFRVQHVTFVGLRHESTVAVLAASGLVVAPLDDRAERGGDRSRLARFPWINTVTITKHWPNSVVVDVHESVAVAVAFNGRVLDFVERERPSPRTRAAARQPADARVRARHGLDRDDLELVALRPRRPRGGLRGEPAAAGVRAAGVDHHRRLPRFGDLQDDDTGHLRPRSAEQPAREVRRDRVGDRPQHPRAG